MHEESAKFRAKEFSKQEIAAMKGLVEAKSPGHGKIYDGEMYAGLASPAEA